MSRTLFRCPTCGNPQKDDKVHRCPVCGMIICDSCGKFSTYFIYELTK